MNPTVETFPAETAWLQRSTPFLSEHCWSGQAVLALSCFDIAPIPYPIPTPSPTTPTPAATIARIRWVPRPPEARADGAGAPWPEARIEAEARRWGAR